MASLLSRFKIIGEEGVIVYDRFFFEDFFVLSD
jgi:hypothetical protein